MLDKKRQDKIKTVAPLEKTIAEILVANGRSVEPFVKIFTYSGENVTKSPLGTLVGVFEIAERSEDSAYIVNFLASVAKKEYFNNPRRSAVESFEAALHKINLALSELVKQGNITWLGKFHGALGVLEKNHLHFSVTGKAEILLLRNNSLTEISAGLASEESHLHPIKTFVEVSSGYLQPQDRTIFTSPELLQLLPIEDLEKNALRMDGEHFGQFLRTVLVNELDMAGTIVIDFQESTLAPTPEKQEEKTTETVNNVFSQKAFTPKTKITETDSPQETDEKEVPAKKEEYVDSKTGHIYIQGDTPGKTETNQNLERAKLSLQNMLHGLGLFFASQGKLLRKGKKYGSILFFELVKTSNVAVRRTARFLRKQLREKFPKKLPTSRQKEHSAQIEQSIISSPLPILQPEPSPKVKNEESSPTATAPDNTEIPPFMQAKLAAFYQKKNNGYLPQSKALDTKRTEARFVPRQVAGYIDPILPALARKQKQVFASLTSFGNNALEPLTSQEKPPTINKDLQPVLKDRPRIDLSALTKSVQTTLASAVEISQKGFAILSSSGKQLLLTTIVFFKHTFVSLKNLPPRQQKIILFGGVACIIILAGIIFLLTHTSKSNPTPVTEISKPQIETPTPPLATEKNVHVIESLTTLSTQNDSVITSVLLNDEAYLITKKNIVSMSDKKQYPLPGNGSTQFAAPMDHLSLIFVYTDIGELFAWSPISRTFIKNTLTLPAGSVIKDIGTYLTYLYVLDKTTNQIYRFPRAEGGFGQSTAWIKNSVNIENTARMAINETIFLAPNNTTVEAFFQGRLIKNLESPIIPLSVAALFTHPGLTGVYVLDTQNKRILVWNQDGVLLTQYYSEKLGNATAITVNEKTSEVFITTANTLLSFKINTGQ